MAPFWQRRTLSWVIGRFVIFDTYKELISNRALCGRRRRILFALARLASPFSESCDFYYGFRRFSLGSLFPCAVTNFVRLRFKLIKQDNTVRNKRNNTNQFGNTTNVHRSKMYTHIYHFTEHCVSIYKQRSITKCFNVQHCLVGQV